MFLYRLGFPYHQLGHVQTGNVFVGSDNSCRLGGYDNTLLGYKTRLFRLCRQHEDHIDVVMFGNYVLVHNIIHYKKMLRDVPSFTSDCNCLYTSVEL